MTQAQGKRQSRPASVRFPQAGRRGFSMVEILVVMLIGGILTAMAIPQVQSGINQYRLDGAIASSTWAIQSTRYEALVQGVQYQVVFTKATNSYQIQSSADGGVTFSNAAGTSAVPLSGVATALNQDTTLRFKPNGFVSAPVGALNFTMTYKGLSSQVCVSNYANIKVIPTSQTCPS